MSQEKGYVNSEYLQIAAKVTERVKSRSYDLMKIRPGHRVLDLGCGPGTDTIALAGLVGDDGSVVGVDWDKEMIAEADRKAEGSGVGSRVEHIRGDATSLPFESGEFDSCRSERLFQHLSHPERALAEMTRVAKPGGWVVVLDTDWGSASIDTPHVDIERRLVRFGAECCLNNGYSGRQLYRLFRQQGLSDIAVEGFCLPILSYLLAREIGRFKKTEDEALSAGIISFKELDTWRASLEKADAEGIFFAHASMVMVAGRTSVTKE